MIKLNPNRISRAVISALALTTLFTACFDDNESETIITNYSNPLITSVSLTANTNVCSNLSSYTFTVDHLGQSDPALIERCRSMWQENDYTQQPGIIFNPDSLPVGTIADSIKVTLSYSSPTSVDVFQYDEELTLRNHTNYLDTQVIWFDDYAVTRIRVVASDGITNKNYFFKMNVHQCASDTIMWRYLVRDLFDMSQVIDQRVDTLGTTLFWYMQLADSSQQVCTADLLGNVSHWSQPVALNSAALLDLGTLLNWKDQLYGVSYDGRLLRSSDGIEWSVASTDFSFVNVLGVQLAARNYSEHLCAIVSQQGSNHFARSNDGLSWQLDTLVVEDIKTTLVPAGFPLKDYTRPISVAANLQNGSTTSRIYLTGGVKADSTLTASTWSTDGIQWVEFEQRSLRPCRRASIVRYTLDVDDPDTFWIMQQGEMEGGYVSDTLYFSQNSGLTWKPLAREYHHLSDTYWIEPFGGSSAFFNPVDYRIYFIGGKDNDGRQLSDIVTGQLPNLAMKQKR